MREAGLGTEHAEQEHGLRGGQLQSEPAWSSGSCTAAQSWPLTQSRGEGSSPL